MKTEDRRVCPSCGNEFSGAMEFCPVCMLHRALAEDVESGESSSEDTAKPKSQGVARRFEHYELVTAKTGDRSSWVAVRWASLTKRSTSIFDAP